ncbi:MAG: fructose-1,6-bisphosphatase [Bacteroidales bacterium]|nr:fructose-1,6-bisphosphatase [Bacteroidales bacterium]
MKENSLAVDQKFDNEKIKGQIKYLNLLANQFPTIQSASSEIINLEAIMKLPKGTEHFLSDIHGEYEIFSHVLRNGSGVIRSKIEDVFKNTLRKFIKEELATLIYYPEEKLALIKKREKDIDEWYGVTLQRLIEVTRATASKYTRSKVRKALPADFAYIIEELLHESPTSQNKARYFEGIVQTIIRIGRASEFIIAICKLIQRLAIDRLHVVGDIFDRGPNPEKVMDKLLEYHAVDVQWGNHDIIWMGSAAGIKAMIANLVRISSRYMNLDTIEDGYGISLMPLATFAMEVYKDDRAELFRPKITEDSSLNSKQVLMVSKMQKAISIIQFKLEAEIINRNPGFEMDDRNLLHLIDFGKGTIRINEQEYKLKDTHFPTIDPKDPYKLTDEEHEVMEKLKISFMHSERLRKHVQFLYAKGSMYLKYNENLLLHGCVPLNNDGSFMSMTINNNELNGAALIDKFDVAARKAYFTRNDKNPDTEAKDLIWYLWCGPKSPLFGKTKMATFERYFISEKETHNEGKNPYFKLNNDENILNLIFEEFGLNPAEAHLINGHVPVKVKKGESPIKANGKLLVIDGGMSKAYQSVTGIAGYTLIYNSYGLVLVAHEAFKSTHSAIEDESDILSNVTYLAQNPQRKTVEDTDGGKQLRQQIDDLEMLLAAYRKGLIKEKR